MAEWISRATSGHGGLTRSEMDNNAEIIYGLLSSDGWTLEAICGVLGNMERESGVNPQAWQGSIGNTRLGYGLTQWSPGSKMISWANASGLNYTDGNTQIARLIGEMNLTYEQYYQTTGYPLSASQFKQATETPSYMAMAFYYNYERGNDPTPELRETYAERFYSLFYGEDPPPTPPAPTPGPGPSVLTNIPIWMLFKFRRFLPC